MRLPNGMPLSQNPNLALTLGEYNENLIVTLNNSFIANLELIENVILNTLAKQNQITFGLIITRSEKERKSSTDLKPKSYFKKSEHIDHGYKNLNKNNQSINSTFQKSAVRRKTKNFKNFTNQNMSRGIESKGLKGGFMPDS